MREPNHFIVGRLRFDPATGEAAGEAGSRRLEPRAAAVLAMLARAEGAMVSRRELLERCWNAGSGSDEALTQAVAQARRVLAVLGEPPGRIVTLAKRGYRLSQPPIAAGLAPALAEMPPMGVERAPRPAELQPQVISGAGGFGLPVRYAAWTVAIVAALALIGWGMFPQPAGPVALHASHAPQHASEIAPAANALHAHEHAPERHSAPSQAGE